MINRLADLEGNFILASFESRGEELGEWIGVGAFDARWPGLGALVAEENVAVVGTDCSGEILREHLRPLESILGVVGVVVFCREVIGFGGHAESES